MLDKLTPRSCNLILAVQVRNNCERSLPEAYNPPPLDIPNYIGIIGTPVIDPATDIVYFYSKTYIPNFRVSGNTGTSNGVYYFHAVNINTLEDVYPPILIDGTSADNAPAKYFVGGVVLQRPSLTQIGNIVYGAFGGHCDLCMRIPPLRAPLSPY